jgi:hypothetical protein
MGHERREVSLVQKPALDIIANVTPFAPDWEGELPVSGLAIGRFWREDFRGPAGQLDTSLCFQRVTDDFVGPQP